MCYCVLWETHIILYNIIFCMLFTVLGQHKQVSYSYIMRRCVLYYVLYLYLRLAAYG
jgi:hypothetical protein